MGDLLLPDRANMDFSRSAALCFTKTWLGEPIPDTTLHQILTPPRGLCNGATGENEGRQNLPLHKQKLVCRCHSVEENMQMDKGKANSSRTGNKKASY